MPSPINSTAIKIWKSLKKSKKYRDAYVAAHVSDTVAAQIYSIRESCGLSQHELAEKTEMKQSRISGLENAAYDNVTIGTLKRIASAFDVALTVRFISFGELAKWMADLSPEKITVPKCDNEAPPNYEEARAIQSPYRFIVKGSHENELNKPIIPSGTNLLHSMSVKYESA